jgi:hypothetical protein
MGKKGCLFLSVGVIIVICCFASWASWSFGDDIISNRNSSRNTTIEVQSQTQEVQTIIEATQPQTEDEGQSFYLPSVQTGSQITDSPSDQQELPQNEPASQPATPPPTSSAFALELIVDVSQILNKSVPEVEAILGPTVLITANDDNDDPFAGGEYRDYQIGKYSTFVVFDRNGVSKLFQIMDGLSVENYSLEDWESLLPRFGMNVQSSPDKSAPAALYWYDFQEFGIAIIAENINGAPVWTVQVADADVFME